MWVTHTTIRKADPLNQPITHFILHQRQSCHSHWSIGGEYQMVFTCKCPDKTIVSMLFDQSYAGCQVFL